MQSLVETIIYRLPDEIKNLVPLRAHSFENFQSLLKSQQPQQPREIFANVAITQVSGVSRTSVGDIGDFEYAATYTAKPFVGPKIVYKEVHTSKFGSSRGFSDADDRHKLLIRSLLTADNRLKILQQEWKKTTVGILNPRTHEPLTRDELKELHRQARSLRLKPYPATTG